jgi:hypothetical protein
MQVVSRNGHVRLLLTGNPARARERRGVPVQQQIVLLCTTAAHFRGEKKTV